MNASFVGRLKRYTCFMFYGIVKGPYVFWKFWKVMEIDNAISKDLERFGKERIFKMAMEKLWILFGKSLTVS